MTALLKKELRLLGPAFGAAVALAVVPIWIWPQNADVQLWVFCAGLLAVGESTFGREVALNMLPWMLAQPVERKRIWRTKMAVLWAAIGTAFVVWLAAGFLLHLNRPPEEIEGCALIVATGVTACLCLTLFLRQTAAAFWLGLLAPLGIGLAVARLFGWTAAAGTLAACAVAGFFLARRQFLRAQDTAWSGGIVSFTLDGPRTGVAGQRGWRPWAALLGKEMQLQHASLLGMGGILLLTFACAACRRHGQHTLSQTTLTTLESAPLLWVLAPLMVGSQSVADERKMGTLPLLCCLPVARWRQWLVKVAFVVAVGGLASGLLYLTMVNLAGAPAPVPSWWPLAAFTALAIIAFYASTLTESFLPALAATVLMTAAIWWIDVFGLEKSLAVGLPAACVLLLLLSPFEALAVLWLSYRNFGRAGENAHLWARNLGAMAAVIVLALAVETALCERVWELVTPLEPAHGPARLSLAHPPRLDQGVGEDLAVVLPDGRLWIGGMTYAWSSSALALLLRGPQWEAMPSGFEPGSNWAGAIVAPTETIALRRDGSLWASTTPEATAKQNTQTGPATASENGTLAPVGNETDWQSMALDQQHRSLLLLKLDGTLWSWETGNLFGKHPAMRQYAPRQIGTNADWSRLIQARGPGPYVALAWKTNGEAWAVAPQEKVVAPPGAPEIQWVWGFVMERAPLLDHQRWRGLVPSWRVSSQVALREDGTLWSWNWKWEQFPPGRPQPQWRNWTSLSLTPIGTDTNWVSIAGGEDLMATKTDGTLWKLREENLEAPTEDSPPRWSVTRWSVHRDWVGVSSINGHMVALAADGGLWHWPTLDSPREFRIYGGPYPGESRKPKLAENIFDSSPAAQRQH